MQSMMHSPGLQNCKIMQTHSLSPLVVVVQSLSCVRLFAAPWTAAHQASPSFTISRSLHKLMSTKSVMPSNHLILCRHLLLLPSVFLSIRVFSPLDFQNFSYLLSSRSYIVKFHHLFSKFFKAICKVLLICSIFDSFQGLFHLKQTNKKNPIYL